MNKSIYNIMSFFKHIFSHHRESALFISGIVFFIVLIKVFAVGPFAPGIENNPGCLPTDPSCVVTVSSGWGLTGTASTTDVTTDGDGVITAGNYIGTSDNMPLNFGVNGHKAGRINPAKRLTSFGYLSDYQSGTDNTAFGYSALFNGSSAAVRDTATGSYALSSVTTGGQNTANGAYALQLNDQGTGNTAVGNGALQNNTTGNSNVAIGSTALSSITGDNNIAIGVGAGSANPTGSGNIYLGYEAGQSATGSNELWIDNGNNATPLIYGDFATRFLGLGTVGPTAFLDITAPTTGAAQLRLEASSAVNPSSPNIGDLWFNGTNLNFRKDGSTTIDLLAGGGTPGWGLTGNASTTDVTIDGSGVITAGNYIGTSDNIPLNFGVNGHKAGRIDPDHQNTFLGYLSDPAAGIRNTGFGYMALANSSSTTIENTAIGNMTLSSLTSGNDNTATGASALTADTSGASNSAFGIYALSQNTTGNSNVAIGSSALTVANGNNNTAIGVGAGSLNTTGSGNVYIGYNAGTSLSGSNELWIDNDSNGIPLIYGDFSTRFVGLGTVTPTSPLQVVGLPVYANNAAAIAGGLTAGAFYRTGGDPDLVAVVH